MLIVASTGGVAAILSNIISVIKDWSKKEGAIKLQDAWKVNADGADVVIQDKYTIPINPPSGCNRRYPRKLRVKCIRMC